MENDYRLDVFFFKGYDLVLSFLISYWNLDVIGGRSIYVCGVGGGW